MFYFYTYSIHPQYTLNILFYIVSSLFKVYFLAPPHSLWYLSSPNRDWTQALAVKKESSNHGTTRKFPKIYFIFIYIYICVCIIYNFQCSFLCVQSLFHLVLFSSTWRIFFTIFYSPGLLVTDSLTFVRKGLPFSFSKLHILYKEF